MTPGRSPYSTGQLTTETWPDFEELFTQGNGWDFCWCMALQRPRPLSSADYPTRAEQTAANRRDKRTLVETGRARGVLVYDDDRPVGWCQYGTPSELPIVDNARSRFGKPRDAPGPPEDWRITCFVVAKTHRRRGVATIALRTALASIRDHGGGIVEAYPIDPATSGSWARGTWGNYAHFGTLSMFEAHGFVRVGWLRTSNAIVRRTVRRRRARTPRATAG